MDRVKIGYHVSSNARFTDLFPVLNDDKSMTNTIAFFPHAINLTSPNYVLRNKSVTTLSNECTIMEYISAKYIIVHPGSTLNQITDEEGINNLADSCIKVIRNTKNITILI